MSTITREEIFDRIKRRVVDELCLTKNECDKVKLETDLVKDLNADELDAVECLLDIEDEFGINIPEEHCETYGMNGNEFKMSKAVDYVYDTFNPPQVPPEK